MVRCIASPVFRSVVPAADHHQWSSRGRACNLAAADYPYGICVSICINLYPTGIAYWPVRDPFFLPVLLEVVIAVAVTTKPNEP